MSILVILLVFSNMYFYNTITQNRIRYFPWTFDLIDSIFLYQHRLLLLNFLQL